MLKNRKLWTTSRASAAKHLKTKTKTYPQGRTSLRIGRRLYFTAPTMVQIFSIFIVFT